MHHIGQIFELYSGICPSWRLFRVGFLKNEDKKRLSMNSYIKAFPRPFVLAFIYESEVLSLGFEDSLDSCRGN
jgi:hypothetical protein